MRAPIRIALAYLAVVLLPATAGIVGWLRSADGDLRGTGILLTLAAAAIAAALLTGLLRRLSNTAELAHRLAAGDLGPDSAEHGISAPASLQLLSQRLAAVLGGLERSSRGVSRLSRSLSDAAGEISAGAANQSEATERGQVLVEKMGLSIETVSNGAGRVVAEVANASTAVEEMSASNQTVVRNTDKLAAGVSENLDMVHQLARSIEEVAASATGAGSASESAVREAREGGRAVRLAADGVEELSRTMREIATVNRSLAGSSERINYIVEVIEEIARKTKLLALNASLQATHAGEHGRSFRAVAVEIKALAERSAGSAKEIGALVEEVQGGIREAETISKVGVEKAAENVTLAQGAGDTLERLVEAIEEVSDNMLAIRDATAQQSGSSERLVATFDQMQRMTDEVAAATRQQRLGGEQILETMERLRGIAAEVGDAVAGHGRDGRQVREAMESIARISAENLSAAIEITGVIESLKSSAAELRSLAAAFRRSSDGASGAAPEPGAGGPLPIAPQLQA